MRKKKKMNKRKKLILVMFLLIVIGISVFTYWYFNKNDNITPEKKVKVVDSIKEYGYTVNDNDTKLFKTKFNSLKKVLNENPVNTKSYAKVISQLFIIDFFTLDNKITKNDVGGVQFVYENYKTSFIDKSRDEFYKYVKNNLNNDRNQQLPIVSEINVDSVEEVTASEYLTTDEFKNIETAYKVNLSWSYKEDLGYQTKATIIVVKDGDKKFSVAKLYNEDEKDTN